MYNDLYETIDNSLTDGNVGARKDRNIGDNIFVLGAVINSVTNGAEEPIQLQVMYVEKCFEKLWLQATTNALFEAGVTSEILNLLFIENKLANIAVKVSGQLTKHVVVKYVEMQGNVWVSLKCTTTMDTLNKTILKQDHLKYKYKNNPNIQIGVPGMVHDTLSISRCENSSDQKNSVINSFIGTQKFTLSEEEKCVMLHIGKKKKRYQQCPSLKLHKNIMKEVTSVKYLGDIISVSGMSQESIENRRNKGWGKIAEIAGTVSEMPDMHKIEVSLKMRETKLCNGLLFNTEAWSSIKDAEYDRLEQVDTALLCQTMVSHSKCSKVFYYLEFGLLSFIHLIMIRRLMFHHHILNRGDTELTKKVYMSQKENYLKCDWIRMLMKDFNFIEEQIDEERIKSTPKEIYRKYINNKVHVGAFKYYIQLKEKSKETEKS